MITATNMIRSTWRCATVARFCDTGLELHASCQRAVDDEVGAAHPAGRGAGEKDHRRGDLLRSAHLTRRVQAHRELVEAGLPVSTPCQKPPSKYVFPGETVLARMFFSASCIAKPWM